jgi:hypothetical protein
LVDDP